PCVSSCAPSTKYSAWKRLPISRPCMSTMATSTVSMAPAFTAAFSSSNPRLPAMSEPPTLSCRGLSPAPSHQHTPKQAARWIPVPSTGMTTISPAGLRILDCRSDNVERGEHFILGNGQRRRQRQHVAHGGLERQPPVERGIHGGLGEFRVRLH